MANGGANYIVLNNKIKNSKEPPFREDFMLFKELQISR